MQQLVTNIICHWRCTAQFTFEISDVAGINYETLSHEHRMVEFFIQIRVCISYLRTTAIDQLTN